MWSSAFVLLCVSYGCYAASLGLLPEPSFQWPKDYHFTGEEIDLTSSVVKNFEVWYSGAHNKSRISLFDGVIQRYYTGYNDDEGYGRIYMFHPETDENDDGVIKCEQMANYYGDQLDFLPELYMYEYAGTEEYGGETVYVYKMDDEMGGLRSTETLYITDKNGVGIPTQHKKRMYNSETGGVMANTIINYFHYYDKLDESDVEADISNCDDWAYGYDESLTHLHPQISRDVDIAFKSFQSHHKKEYKKHEEPIRKALFENSWRRVKNHNAKNLSYKMSVNKFSDRTAQELRYLFGIKYNGPIRGTEAFPYSVAEVDLMSSKKEIPDEYDMRQEGLVSPIKNQGECGSCWAFATAAALEGALARKNGGRVYDLSEQALVDCSWNYEAHGCEGAENIVAGLKSASAHGIPTDGEYGPYLMEDGLCHVNNVTEAEYISGFVAVTPNSENALKAAVFKHGPVVIGIEVTNNMIGYSSGVFYDFECSPEAMNHAVTVVGYGEYYGDLYWIVKNSWGQDWGEAGYILMAAKDNNCNVMTTPAYAVV